MANNKRFGLAPRAAALASCLAFASCAAQRTDGADAAAPRFRVDAVWPKPLPNNSILGQVRFVRD
jgi:hypothetical protein